MTRGADIIAAIILLALAIAIVVYLLHWLYRRSSKEVSFVRTGMLGEKVVISGGAFVLPIIHNITQVGMRTLSITIKRAGEKSLITKDRMRAELVTEFFTKVPPEQKAVATAAQTNSDVKNNKKQNTSQSMVHSQKQQEHRKSCQNRARYSSNMGFIQI